MAQILIKFKGELKDEFTIVDSINTVRGEEKFSSGYRRDKIEILGSWRVLKTIKQMTIEGIDYDNKPKIYKTIVELKENEYLYPDRLKVLAGMNEIKKTDYEILGYRVAKDRWDKDGFKIFITN